MAKDWQDYRKAGSQAILEHDYAEAEAQWFAAMQEAELFDRSDRRLHITLEDLAELYFRTGKHLHAEALMRRLYDIYRTTMGEDHIDVGIVAANLAAMLFAGGHLEDAEIFYRRALTIKTLTSPKTDADLIALRVQYAHLLRQMGRHEEADALTQSAQKQKQLKFKRSGIYDAYVLENPEQQAPKLEDRLLNAVMKTDTGKRF